MTRGGVVLRSSHFSPLENLKYQKRATSCCFYPNSSCTYQVSIRSCTLAKAHAPQMRSQVRVNHKSDSTFERLATTSIQPLQNQQRFSTLRTSMYLMRARQLKLLNTHTQQMHYNLSCCIHVNLASIFRN
jgi:hypothetical protein